MVKVEEILEKIRRKTLTPPPSSTSKMAKKEIKIGQTRISTFGS